MVMQGTPKVGRRREYSFNRPMTYVLVFKDEIRICVVPQILGFSSLPPALKLEGGQGLNFFEAETVCSVS